MKIHHIVCAWAMVNLIFVTAELRGRVEALEKQIAEKQHSKR